jgi:2-dehydropantoate 2-reductase
MLANTGVMIKFLVLWPIYKLKGPGMRIAVIGAGAVGGFYGARLARQGHDVHFLFRRDLQAVREKGLTIKSWEGDFHLDTVQAHGDSKEIGPVELVLCALKATSIGKAEALLRPCVGPDTRILTMINGLGIEEYFASWFGPENILGGLAFICSNRGEPGVIHHLDHGRVSIGHYQDDQQQAREVADLFAEAGIETSVAESLKQARWVKLMWNVPFSTLAITAGGVTTREIISDEGLHELARKLMLETGTAGNADGCNIDVDNLMEKMFKNTGTMGAYKPSMLIDYKNRRPMEVEAILGEPVRRAAAIGIHVPTIEAQYYLCRFLDRLNRGEVTTE